MRHQRARPATQPDDAHRLHTDTDRRRIRHHAAHIAVLARAGNGSQQATRDRSTTSRLTERDAPAVETASSQVKHVRPVGPEGGGR